MTDISKSSTEWHNQWQKQFAETQCEVTVCSSESNSYRRADVMTNNLVLEFQHSSISQDELYTRTLFYKNLKKTVWWIFDRTHRTTKELHVKNNKYGYDTSIYQTKFLNHILKPLAANQVNSIFLDYGNCIIWLWNITYDSNNKITAKNCYIINNKLFIDLVLYKIHEPLPCPLSHKLLPYYIINNNKEFYKNNMQNACIDASTGCINTFTIINLFDMLDKTIIYAHKETGKKYNNITHYYLSHITYDDNGEELPTIAYFQQELCIACDESELNETERGYYKNYIKNKHTVTLEDICKEVITQNYML